MNAQNLTDIVEKNTGAILVNGVPLGTIDMDKIGMNEVDKFWSRFFAAEASYDSSGNLTDEAKTNMLSYLEAVSYQARVISLELFK